MSIRDLYKEHTAIQTIINNNYISEVIKEIFEARQKEILSEIEDLMNKEKIKEDGRSERAKVLEGIIVQSENIVKSLGNCVPKNPLKEAEIRRGNYDLLFYSKDCISKSKKELEEIKQQHIRNISWANEELEKNNE